MYCQLIHEKSLFSLHYATKWSITRFQEQIWTPSDLSVSNYSKLKLMLLWAIFLPFVIDNFNAVGVFVQHLMLVKMNGHLFTKLLVCHYQSNLSKFYLFTYCLVSSITSYWLHLLVKCLFLKTQLTWTWFFVWTVLRKMWNAFNPYM